MLTLKCNLKRYYFPFISDTESVSL